MQCNTMNWVNGSLAGLRLINNEILLKFGS